jgi:hypothetical protein
MELRITKMPTRHIEDVVEPQIPRNKTRKRKEKKSVSKRGGRGRKRK